MRHMSRNGHVFPDYEELKGDSSGSGLRIFVLVIYFIINVIVTAALILLVVLAPTRWVLSVSSGWNCSNVTLQADAGGDRNPPGVKNKEWYKFRLTFKVPFVIWSTVYLFKDGNSAQKSSQDTVEWYLCIHYIVCGSKMIQTD